MRVHAVCIHVFTVSDKLLQVAFRERLHDRYECMAHFVGCGFLNAIYLAVMHPALVVAVFFCAFAVLIGEHPLGFYSVLLLMFPLCVQDRSGYFGQCEYSLGVLVLTGGFLAVDVYTAFQEHRAVSDVRTFQPDHLARAQPCGNFEPVSVDEQLVRRLAPVLGGINVEKFPQVVRLQDGFRLADCSARDSEVFREQRGVLAFPTVFHKRRDTAPDILQGLFRELLRIAVVDNALQVLFVQI